MNKIKIALAGQPNCGKSTIFNLISGLDQHIANYPGVTVDKKSGFFRFDNYKVEMVDLPGTYSFSSYSLEERVAKEYIIEEKPDIIVNIIDASNIKRNLYLTFQLLEIGIPVIVVLNMMDVASRRGIEIDSKKISILLNSPVIEASAVKRSGDKEIMKTIIDVFKNKKEYKKFKLSYSELEAYVLDIEEYISKSSISLNKRWVSIKCLENDSLIINKLKKQIPNIEDYIKNKSNQYNENFDKNIVATLASIRYESADIITYETIEEKKLGIQTLTDRVDKIVLNKYLALPILIFFMFTVYQVSIVWGYKLTDYTWPILAAFKNYVIDILPRANIIEIPMITDFAIWMVNSANALLNYIPIFFILFLLIAILEDVGYMPRMAFILDRVFKKFGLHGQSTLPLFLGGAMVGGCAVPGVMATKGIADDKARMATILSVPYMNCLAKIPFYTLLLGAFFKFNMALMMFFISTVTLFIAMIVAKILTLTILKTRETAPFLMELPPYHLPTFKGLVISASQRVWLYIKKVVTIVLAVAIVLFALLQFPGLSVETKNKYNQQVTQILSNFDKKAKKSTYYKEVDSRNEVSELLNYYDAYKSKRMLASTKKDVIFIDNKYMQINKNFFKFIKPRKDKEAKKINKALRKLSSQRKKILRNIKNEKIENSLLGMTGRLIEPISKYAGFDWKINVAFLSSFAARESAVATLGSLYENNKADNIRAEEAMVNNSGYTALHATSIIIFMILTPPCIATMIVVKMQTNSYKWMLFAIFFPLTLGIFISSIIFSLGINFSWTGVEAMALFYFTILTIVLIISFYPNKRLNWMGGIKLNNQGVAKIEKE